MISPRKLWVQFALLTLPFQVFGQQDLQSSTYVFSPLAFNPAYAGSRGTLNVHAVNRAQWLGFDGAPNTQILSVNAPLVRRTVGVGGTFAADRTGARSQTTGLLHLAYHLRLSNEINLSLGISGGTVSNGYDFTDLIADDPGDVIYNASYRGRAWNFGSGSYLWGKDWYVGLSIPHLIRQPLVRDDLNSPVLLRHVYLSGGHIWETNTLLSYRVNGLLKMTSNAPVTMDLMATAWAMDVVGFGVLVRLSESIGFHAAYQVRPDLQIMYAIDMPFNRMRTGNVGSHELAILFDLSKRKVGYESPRYF